MYIRLFTTLILCAIARLAMAQENYVYRYWFDSDDKNSVTNSSNEENLLLSIDASSLSSGFHVLNYQVIDNEHGFSGSKSSIFYKPETTSHNTESLEYDLFIDGELCSNYNLNQSSNGLIHFDINLSHLSIGLHSLNIQIKSDRGISNVSSYFLRISPYADNVADLEYYYTIDNSISTKKVYLLNNEYALVEFDVSTLSEGLHTISFFTNSSDGTTIPLASSFFLKTAPDYDYDNLDLFYCFDNDFESKKKTSLSNGGINTVLDLTELSEGLHSISFFIAYPNGSQIPLTSNFFLKEPVGGIGISGYEYWINDDTSNKTIQTYNPLVNSTSLISILDLPSHGLRSSNFLLNKENDELIIYPVNTFSFKAEGASERFKIQSSDYVDVTRPTKLVPAEMPILFSGKIQEIEELTDNKIKWFRFNGCDGDSISLKTNQACTIDVFNSDGELLNKSKGLKSIQPEGFFLDATGEYYVAVHDITSSPEGNVSLDFYQIGKYAVVDYDVKEVGNGGLTTITFNGNGYFSLNDLTISKNGSTIPCADLKYISNTKLQATFDFGGVDKGKYDLAFQFLDETLTIKKGINVVDALPIEIEKKIEYDNIFYIGHEPFYDIEVSNKGNNTAYSVPIFVYIETKLTDHMPRITLTGFNTTRLFDEDDLSELSEEDASTLRDFEKQIGNSLSFMKFKTANENGDSILINSGYFFINIPPNTSKNLSISVATTDSIQCYITTPEEWPTFTAFTNSHSAQRFNAPSRGGAMDYFCCYRERIDCVLNLVATANDLASLILPNVPNVAIATTIISCATSGLQALSTSVGDTFCQENATQGEMNLYEKLVKISQGISYGDLIYNCALAAIEGTGFSLDALNWYDIVSKLNSYTIGLASNTISCIQSFTTKKPNCPPGDSDGGKIDPVQSYDPNDIHGYLTKTGTHFIGIDKKRLSYTIEFENDSTMATAPAHKINIKDILNTQHFDVSSVHTSKIVIGNQIFDIDKDGEFVKTVDLRPAIQALAEMRLTINKSTGEMEYSMVSLDPLTVAPTMEYYSGILPVNNSKKDGQGYIVFDVALQDNIDDGTLVHNQASIVFDANLPIETPTWTNETDYVRPRSYITDITVINKNKITINFDGIDTRSGIWKYDLYYQLGQNSDWFLLQEGLSTSSYTLDVYDDIDYGFCVVATDMAENLEEKPLFREFSCLNGEISSIEEIAIDNIVKLKGIYDLLGRKVKEPLQPGFYIMNGEKVLIK